MKRCPECRRDYYDDTLGFCLEDGTQLVQGSVPVGQALSDEPATAIIPTSPLSHRAGGDTAATVIFQSQENTGAPVGHRRWISVTTGIFATVILLAGAGFALYRFLSVSPASSPPRANQPVNITRLTGDGKARGAEISPDGKFLAYIQTEGGERSIWIKQILTNSNIAVLKPGELDRFDGLTFSPDGNFLYFNAETKTGEVPSIYRVPTLGGTPTKVLSNASNVHLSQDGRFVSFLRVDFATSESAIIVANADGSNDRKIAARTGDQFFDGSPVWSPDGRMIAVPAGDDSKAPDPHVFIALISVESGQVSEHGTVRWAGINDLVWHPSGDSIIAGASDDSSGSPQIWEISYPAGTMRRLTNNTSGHSSVSITADGKSIVTGEIYSRSAVWVSPDLKAENAKPVMSATGDTWGFGWTPDNRIVYVSDQTGDTEVWIMDADGANAKPLTSDRIYKTTPVVSPDGRYIVYASSSGTGQIVRMDINGGNPLVIGKDSLADNPDVSTDSKWVIYSAFTGGLQKVLRVPIEGGEPQSLTNYRATEPRYSRDGTRFACFMPNEKTQSWTRLAIVPAEGGEPIKVFDVPPNTNMSRGPIWTPDDRGITLVVSPGQLQNLWLQPIDGGVAKAITNFQLPGIARREYSRDGRRIAIVRAEGIGNAIMITGFR